MPVSQSSSAPNVTACFLCQTPARTKQATRYFTQVTLLPFPLLELNIFSHQKSKMTTSYPPSLSLLRLFCRARRELRGCFTNTLPLPTTLPTSGNKNYFLAKIATYSGSQRCQSALQKGMKQLICFFSFEEQQDKGGRYLTMTCPPPPHSQSCTVPVPRLGWKSHGWALYKTDSSSPWKQWRGAGPREDFHRKVSHTHLRYLNLNGYVFRLFCTTLV